jgi:hypothetical protein
MTIPIDLDPVAISLFGLDLRDAPETYLDPEYTATM